MMMMMQEQMASKGAIKTREQSWQLTTAQQLELDGYKGTMQAGVLYWTAAKLLRIWSLCPAT